MVPLEQWDGVTPLFPSDKLPLQASLVVVPWSPQMQHCLQDAEAGFKVLFFFTEVVHFYLTPQGTMKSGGEKGRARGPQCFARVVGCTLPAWLGRS